MFSVEVISDTLIVMGLAKCKDLKDVYWHFIGTGNLRVVAYIFDKYHSLTDHCMYLTTEEASDGHILRGCSLHGFTAWARDKGGKF